jgi:hypothetical protein
VDGEGKAKSLQRDLKSIVELRIYTIGLVFSSKERAYSIHKN